MSLPPIQRQRIISSQRDAWRRYGYHPNALYWSNQEIQEIRFRQLLKLGMTSGQSLLDVGCGFGDFSAWLQGQGIQMRYTGIDLSAELLQEGRRRFPQIELIEADLFEFDPPPRSYDWATLSGALNRNLDDHGKYALSVISRMYDTCRQGMAFNLLDARHSWTAGRWDLQSFRPKEIALFLSELGAKYHLVEGYLPNDFTFLCWKADAIEPQPA